MHTWLDPIVESHFAAHTRTKLEFQCGDIDCHGGRRPCLAERGRWVFAAMRISESEILVSMLGMKTSVEQISGFVEGQRLGGAAE